MPAAPAAVAGPAGRGASGGPTWAAGAAGDRRYADHRQPVPLWLGPVARRTWSEFLYLCAALVLAPFAFAYAVLTVSVAAVLLVTVAGMFVPGYLVLGGRAWGGLYRAMARSMLAVDVMPPAPFRRGSGFWAELRGMLTDAAGWRALAFLAVAFPLAIAGVICSVVTLALGVGGVTYWLWERWLPFQQLPDGSWYRGVGITTSDTAYLLDTTTGWVVMAVLGILFVLVWPRATAGFAHLFRLLTVNLLAPTPQSLRVQDLEQARGRTVDDADARLRRIERDLHDGTQARLVAVAMQLGEAKEQLAAGGDRAEALALVDTAHLSVKESLVELRELARGIHPPVLDNGLAAALETVAARTPLPVTIDVEPGLAPAPAVETIAYFCVTELVTNAVKHAAASGVYVLIEASDGAMRLRVRDDGRGGATPTAAGADGRGSGLAGLAERVRSVDGTMEVESPPGGPTVVTVTLPLRVS